MMETAQVGGRAVRVFGLALLLAVGGIACQPLPDEFDFDFQEPTRQPPEARLLLELLEVCVVEDGPGGVDPCGELPNDFDFAWDPEVMVGGSTPEHASPDAELGVETDADFELLMMLLSAEVE